MNISALSIQRPVLAIVMTVVLLVFGIVGFMYLGIREYPVVEPAVITVTTTYPGANADVIESQVTEPLEQTINSIDGIKQITSTSREQASIIRIEFEVEVDLEAAANDVRDQVSRARRQLPQDIDNPIVDKSDASGQSIIYMTVSSNTRSILEVSEYANNVLKEKIQTIKGVSMVQVFGEKKPAMRLWMDPQKMSAANVSPQDVQVALARENIELPSGRIEGDNTELSVRTSGLLSTAEDFDNLLIRNENGRSIRFKDIGYAGLGPENPRNILKRNGAPMVGVSVQPQPNANSIDIADEFYVRLEQLKKEVPEDIDIEIGYDFTTYVRKAIVEVQETIYVAFGLVVVVIFLFLRDWRTTIIPVVAIPVSIISAFFIMYIAGFSINILTLMAIVLAIGLVCDDAIVVMENIYSKIEQKMHPVQAAFAGIKEIYFAVIATTIAIVAVFLPVLFMDGLTGQLFKEFGVVLSGAVIVSSFVALTLSPMMSSKVLKYREKPNKLYLATEPFFNKLSNAYQKALDSFLERRWLAWPALGACFALVIFLFTDIHSELAPVEDRSNLRIMATAPEGISYDYMEKHMDMLNDLLMEAIPEVKTPLTIVAPSFGAPGLVNSGIQSIYLVDAEDRQRSQQDIYNELTFELKKVTSLRTTVVQPPTIGSRFGGPPLQYVILASSFDSLRTVLPRFLEEARKRPELTFVDADVKFNKPEITLDINREKASLLGVSVEDVARTLQLALSEQRYGYYIMDGRQYQVIGQVTRQYRDKPTDILNLQVRTKSGKMVQLDNIVTLKEEVNPPARYRFNRYASATISGGMSPGYTLGDGIAALDEVKEKVLDEHYSTALAGQSKDFSDSSKSLYFAFGLALLLVYLVLSAQFNSFRDPFIILLTVPMAVAGALLSLWYFDQTFNVFSQIGIIMLVGLVTKNGILIVEFANQKKEAGMSVLKAALEASTQRLRPILMTSMATILGILPLAMSLGSSSGSRQSLGIAVVGGLLFSGFLTLFIIPAVYTWLTSPAKKKEVTSNVEVLEA
ncbi:efflux RND transporter permease subunit [Cytophagaceae bacterium ABcell3]|nr:efflux RND transporter permease subunit [Cytophagaceae bacterium ABcell3]